MRKRDIKRKLRKSAGLIAMVIDEDNQIYFGINGKLEGEYFSCSKGGVKTNLSYKVIHFLFFLSDTDVCRLLEKLFEFGESVSLLAKQKWEEDREDMLFFFKLHSDSPV